MQFANWAADGSHLYLSGGRDRGGGQSEFGILETDLAGNFKVLIRVPGGQVWFANPIPSPDGHYLIYTERIWPSSVMVLENF